jgi:hypothetical protein
MTPYYNPGSGPLNDEDLVCIVCQTPLLSKKTTCPKCGNKWGDAPQAAPPKSATVSSAKKSAKFIPESVAPLPVTGPSGDDLFTSVLIFIAGQGLLFSLVSPFVGGFSMEELWRSMMLIAVSAGLLGLRRLTLMKGAALP